MKIYRLFPYELYALEEIENWLNSFGEKGYQLKSLNYIATFEYRPNKTLHYRVRYIPGNRNCADTVFWGDLYVYINENPQMLPPSFSVEEIKAAAKPLLSPLSIIFTVAILQGILIGTFDLIVEKQLFWGALSILTGVLFLITRVSRWKIAAKRSRGITPEKINKQKYIRYLDFLSFVFTLVLSVVVEFCL